MTEDVFAVDGHLECDNPPFVAGEIYLTGLFAGREPFFALADKACNHSFAQFATYWFFHVSSINN